MKVRNRDLGGIPAIVAVLILSSCAGVGGKDWVELKDQAVGSAQTHRILGTVHRMDLEGGLYVIRDGEGTNYNPVNLPEAFRIEGMAVEADIRRQDDLMSIGMVGPIVELLRIRKHSGVSANSTVQ